MAWTSPFYRAAVATDQLGYVNYDNRSYVLDLSGIASDAARKARAENSSLQWMDTLLARHNIGLALIDTAHGSSVPSQWIDVAELVPSGEVPGEETHRFIFFARRASDVDAVVCALNHFAPTLPSTVRLLRIGPAAADVSSCGGGM